MSTIDASPGLVPVKAGTLNDTSWLNLKVEIWRDKAQPWVPSIRGARVHETALPLL